MEEKKNQAANGKTKEYTKPVERLDVQTVVTNADNGEKTYLEGIVADYQKIKAMTGANRFTVKVMVAFKVLGNDDKYKTLKFEYFVIQ